MRGRRPKPTIIKILEGNRSRVHLDLALEPQPEKGEPFMPPELGAAGRAKWAQLVPVLLKSGILTNADEALIGYCAAFEKWLGARRTIKREGRYLSVVYLKKDGTKTSAGKKIHPAVGEEKDALLLMHRFGIELGLSPVSRSRIKVEKQAGDAKEERFFG